MAFPSLAFAQDPNKALADAIGALAGSLTQEALRDSRVKTAIDNLAQQAAQLDCRLPCKTQALATAIGKWVETANITEETKGLTAEQRTAIATLAVGMIRTLVALEHLDVTIAVKEEINRLTQILKEPEKINTAAIATDLTALRVALAKMQPSPKINVLGAWFGDLDLLQSVFDQKLRPHENGRRFCAATRAVRARCQGKAECLVTPQTGSDEISGAKMCGYDPVPYAETRLKGLFVYYECVARDESEWLLDNGSLPVKVGDKSDDRGALLHPSAINEIRCQRPASTGGGGTGAPSGAPSTQN